MAVYHGKNTKTDESRLILIQPSKSSQDRLKQIIRAPGVLEDCVILAHVVILEAAESDWEPYLRYSKQQFNRIANAAQTSQVINTGKKPKTFRYSADSHGNLVKEEIKDAIMEDTNSLCFKDSQRLEFLYEQLSRCSAIIQNSIDIATGCLAFCEALRDTTTTAAEVREASSNKLHLYIRRMKMHAQAAELLTKQVEKTAQVISQILHIRNEAEALRNTTTMRDMLKLLTDLGNSAKNESESLRVISEQSARDSRFTTVLSFTAILYLPASLVATIFSSNLVRSSGDEDTAGGRFVVAAQFWLFPVLAVALTLVTLVPTIVALRMIQARGFKLRGIKED
ncbi:hypothetical protein QBC37DRAFT_465241 [Rhypophila decipiens]|uniref:Uncharacterized protein n=1 Tax=Rhypophila decipiens TaxID=261697 RepID=A0AAN7B780_9PEZI|nr:hypothetical protein QBC37DRAFT_465241 [Rhypophila decipiens]